MVDGFCNLDIILQKKERNAMFCILSAIAGLKFGYPLELSQIFTMLDFVINTTSGLSSCSGI